MGEEGSTKRVPSHEQLAAMQLQVREAMQAGAIGFASSFSPNHSGWAGTPMPSTIAEDEEFVASVQRDLDRLPTIEERESRHRD